MFTVVQWGFPHQHLSELTSGAEIHKVITLSFFVAGSLMTTFEKYSVPYPDYKSKKLLKLLTFVYKQLLILTNLFGY